jgi:hypothetical protein
MLLRADNESSSMGIEDRVSDATRYSFKTSLSLVSMCIKPAAADTVLEDGIDLSSLLQTSAEKYCLTMNASIAFKYFRCSKIFIRARRSVRRSTQLLSISAGRSEAIMQSSLLACVSSHDKHTYWYSPTPKSSNKALSQRRDTPCSGRHAEPGR